MTNYTFAALAILTAGASVEALVRGDVRMGVVFFGWAVADAALLVWR